MEQVASPTKPVPAITRATQILDALSEDAQPRGVSELARALGLPRSTVHGICRTLADLGILARVNETDFVVGPHVLQWSSAFESQSSLTTAFAALAGAADRAESLNVSVLAGGDVMYIACRQGTDPLGVRFREGLRFPAPYTATGKAILSTMPDADVTALFKGAWPPPCSSLSIDNVGELLIDLAETRSRGYSVDLGQLRESMTCCGAPVFSADSPSRAIAGVAVAVLTSDLDSDGIERIGAAAMSFASSLSHRLGANAR
jgi:DNA-binding IclR family transcriptional regulator